MLVSTALGRRSPEVVRTPEDSAKSDSSVAECPPGPLPAARGLMRNGLCYSIVDQDEDLGHGMGALFSFLKLLNRSSLGIS